MPLQRFTIVLTVLNFLLLLLLLSERHAIVAQDVPDVLRARAWELVDERGQARATMVVAPDGEAVFRLKDSRGTIRVKIGANDMGSGLVLLDGRTEPGIQITADASGSSMKLTNRDGRQRIVQP